MVKLLLITMLLYVIETTLARTISVLVNRELSITGGNWSRSPPEVCNGDGALFTSGVGDTLSYDFEGTSISVYLLQIKKGSLAHIALDRVSVGVVDLYDPASRVSSCKTTQWKSGQLPDGNHTIVISHYGNSVLQGSAAPSTLYVDRIEYTVPDAMHNKALAPAPVVTRPDIIASKSAKRTKTIIGATAGGATLLASIALITWLIIRRRKQNTTHLEENRSIAQETRYEKVTEPSAKLGRWPSQSFFSSHNNLLNNRSTDSLSSTTSTEAYHAPHPPPLQHGKFVEIWTPHRAASQSYTNLNSPAATEVGWNISPYKITSGSDTDVSTTSTTYSRGW